VVGNEARRWSEGRRPNWRAIATSRPDDDQIGTSTRCQLAYRPPRLALNLNRLDFGGDGST
jgi:hypothetical protein